MSQPNFSNGVGAATILEAIQLLHSDVRKHIQDDDERFDSLRKSLNAETERHNLLVKETAAQTVMLTQLTTATTKVLGNPMIRVLLTMLGTAALTWLAAHGGKV